jgi:type II secretory pathway pseudopilin PulG
MSTGVIVAIVVVAVIVLLALLVLMPRMRERSRERRRERLLEQRRQQAAAEHRQVAETRAQSAEAAEQRARMAEQEARRERAEAELHQERATAAESGHVDDQLLNDEDRERLGYGRTGTPATADGDGRTEVLDSDGDRTSAYGEGRRAAREPARAGEFEEGRVDQARQDEDGGFLGRFRRSPASDREPTERT